MDTITLPAEHSSIGAARRFVASKLAEALTDPHDVVLMTSELVANVVNHARTEVTVAVAAGPPVRVEVWDGAAASEAFRELIAAPPPPVPPDAPGGRGLGIVHALAARVGLIEDPAGSKRVWFEYEPPA